MLPRLPLAAWVNDIVHWLYVLIGPFLGDVANVIRVVVDGATNGLSAVPWWIVVLVLAVLAYLSGKWKLTLGTIIGLTLIFDLGLWDDMITTLALQRS
ncbi:MAG: hypothetical protein OWS03_07125 [Alicyclobacillaceae bacterium]|nr:hypothetical protein [Alicyclobacillaceae bacterium]